jgi:hypothetical protein
MTTNNLSPYNSKSKFHLFATFSFALTFDSSHTYYFTQLYLHTLSLTNVPTHILTLIFQLSYFNVYNIARLHQSLETN